MKRALLVVAVLAALALSAKFWDDWTIAACNARSTQEMENYSRDWIVHHWTKRQRPNDRSALPNDITAAQLVLVPEASPITGYSFHTDVSGGVAFYVWVNDHCNIRVEAEPCGVGQCNFPS